MSKEWQNQQRNELYYYITKISNLNALYGEEINNPRFICDALEEILSPDYNGNDVVNAVQMLIKSNNRIPLPSEIATFIKEKK